MLLRNNHIIRVKYSVPILNILMKPCCRIVYPNFAIVGWSGKQVMNMHAEAISKKEGLLYGIGSHFQPCSLSFFRNVNSLHRQPLYSTYPK